MAESTVYLGRIVAAAITQDGRATALYRISSRSFPNRRAVLSADGKSVAILPKPGSESDSLKNPYISYNCARIIGDTAIVTNGSHTDPIAEKIAAGMPARDALALSLLAMDYEKDQYNTPRIATVVRRGGETWLGVVRDDGLDVRKFVLRPGEMAHISTYVHNLPTKHHISAFTAKTAAESCGFALAGGVFANFSNPVTAVAAMENASGGFDVSALDA